MSFLMPITGFVSETERLMQRYSMTLDEALGRYYLRCSLNGSPCCMCRGIESGACDKGLLSVSGLNAKSSQTVLLAMESARFQESLLQSYQLSGNLPWGDDAISKPGMKDEDFLHMYDKFPNDVSMSLPPRFVENKLSMNKLLGFQHGRTIRAKYAYWTPERADAGRGMLGALAKRCAIDDTAWMHWCLTPPEARTPANLRKRMQLSYLEFMFQRHEANPALREKILEKMKTIT